MSTTLILDAFAAVEEKQQATWAPGNYAAIGTTRRGCDVIATDYVAQLLERASQRALAEQLPLTTQVADAEDLPFEDAAAELVRVVRPGGHIGLANWTPEGFVGQMFKIAGQHNPPPAGALTVDSEYLEVVATRR